MPKLSDIGKLAIDASSDDLESSVDAGTHERVSWWGGYGSRALLEGSVRFGDGWT